jgi:formylglycine-generating enzyme required for sulfatase activity
MPAPTVFLSSTSLDLKPYRDAALEAARAAGFAAICMEDFTASGARYTLQECLTKVEQADVLVVLAAHRYGWVPPGNTKSVTWLECEHARNKKNIEVIAFVVKEDFQEWPYNLREVSRLDRGDPSDQVMQAIVQLKAFKQWLAQYITAEFAAPSDVNNKVYKALRDWKERHPGFGPPPSGNPADYVHWLREDTRSIKIEGINVSGRDTQQFGIRQIYIPLTTTLGVEAPKGALEGKAEVPLQEALAKRKLIIVGDPGSGKTTFLRRVAFELCQADAESERFLGFHDGSLPVLIRIARLSGHIRNPGSTAAPTSPDSPEWLLHFLERQAQECNWNLTAAFFRQKLQQGSCRLLLDGLDETPDETSRRAMVRLIEQAANAYRRSSFVVTTRPVARLALDGFDPVGLDRLTEDAIHTFLDEWSRALYEREQAKAESFSGSLKEAIRSRPEIRNMARNPVMLTALAVLQANNRVLPQHRVELYEEILTWLAGAREQDPLSAARRLELHQKLAFRMQAHPGGRKERAGIGWAAGQLEGEFPTPQEAERLLEREQTVSGIIVSRGAELEFWHLTFQEFLAARQIAAFGEDRQRTSIIDSGNLYKPEWREVMRLLGGVLKHKQGREKVDGLFGAILNELEKKPGLAAQAQCAALLGLMMRDLERMDYEPNDPRYKQTLHAMRSLFDPVQSAGIDLRTRIEAAEALGQAGDPRLEEENWIRIPAGKFWMGAQKKTGRNQDEEAHSHESPVHEVSLNEFLIGRYPVTVQEYQKFIEEGGYEKEDYWGETGGFGLFKAPKNWEEQQSHGNRPVTGVSWFEASGYCKWAKGRLPTEAEWERAGRGTRENAKYPWGNDPIDETRANYGNKVGRPTPVGLYPKGATTEGVDDMLGNVWEWCADWFGDYPEARVENPKGPQSGLYKVLRGGSWVNLPIFVRVSIRDHFRPEFRDVSVGFRCVRESLNS